MGVPSAVSTLTASLNASVTSTVSPGDHAPSAPAALTAGADVTSGASVCRAPARTSTVIVYAAALSTVPSPTLKVKLA